jgi:ubiquitin carboxyl-terminal hydrolase 7
MNYCIQATVVEGTIQKLFEGHHMNYIECINVDYKSTRKESFYDLQLDVKGCRDVYASFDKYVEVERLEGDNKYHAEQYGLQDAKKGVLFIDFPPVLQLQLKRFEYDFMRDTMVKTHSINLMHEKVIGVSHLSCLLVNCMILVEGIL